MRRELWAYLAVSAVLGVPLGLAMVWVAARLAV